METKKTQPVNLLIKGLVIFVTAVLMLVPMFMVRGVISEREDMSAAVRDEICRSWGGSQVIYPPVFRVMARDPETDGKGVSVESHGPEEVKAGGTVSVDILKRSIYEVPVYTCDVTLSGTFLIDSGTVARAHDAERCGVWLDVGSVRGLSDNVVMLFGGREYELNPESGGLFAELPPEVLTPDQPMEYSLTVSSKGTESLSFVPDAKKYSLVLESDYCSPSFTGAALPSVRTVTDEGFSAEWDIYGAYTGISGMYDSEFGVDFVVPVSHYQQTDRAIKYFFLVVCLVFMGIFLAEAILRINVNVVQYVVTGLSLCLFYLILLSFVEYASFPLAYLVASVLTVASLGGYFAGILGIRLAGLFTVCVSLVYGFVFMLLNMQTGSLLVGTLALFIILCAIMYFTKDLNKNA